jgi:hypothetical protein
MMDVRMTGVNKGEVDVSTPVYKDQEKHKKLRSER